MKSLNFLGDGLEEESSNEDQITEMIKEIGKYNDVTEFSFLRMTSDEYYDINLDLRLWGFAYKHAFFFALDVLQKQLKNLKTEEERRGRLEKILGWERLNAFSKGLQETILLS